ncbi:conserved exported protein of unknown function [Tenacibaculum sp. 190524A02b]|uniref:hypothetical protein n=1 Tax=Tenacibaculum vairaonense TaxID=3137860 RepID=UPI0032B2F0C1
MGKLKIVKGIVLAVILMATACQKNEEIPVNTNNLLVGYWANAVHTDDSITFERVGELPTNNYGIAFKENNVFIQRTSGWCGTPPLSFYDDNGTYEKNEDQIKITLSVFPLNYNWKILELTKEKLKVKVELSDREKEHQALLQLFDEIKALATSKTCEDDNDWTFTAYGSKACGGPQGYIAYSKKINVPEFLQKVTVYTQAEAAFNKKWGVVSTCDIIAQPTGVTCENGKAVLKY